MIRQFAAVALTLVFSSGVAASEAPPVDLEALDARLAEIIEAREVVGAGVAVFDLDGVMFARGYGYVDREAGIEAGADTAFRAGSVSKLVTALAAMRLAEAGSLDLDAPLRVIAPEIDFTNRFESEHPVRLAHLLEHTTGWDDIQPQEYRNFPEGTRLADGLADNPRSRTSRWAPGHYASYSNSGAAVMGRVIEIVTGQPFEAAARTLVFEPLGLASASFDQDAPERRIASYHTVEERADFTRIWAAPSGGLSISARDLGEVGRVLLSGGGGLISAQSVARMEHGQTSRAARAEAQRYGLGFFEWRAATGVWTGHGGAIDRAQAEVFYDRASGRGYALLVNTGGRGMPEMRTALRTALGAPEPRPEAEAGWHLPEGAAGMYRIINPRQEMFRIMLDLLQPRRVWQCGGEMCVATGFGGEPRRYTPMGGGHFFMTEEPFRRMSVIAADEGRFELVYDDGESWARSSRVRLLAPPALLVATLLAFAVGVLTLLIWAAARPFGVFRGSNRWRVWIWPSLSVALLGLGAGAFMTLSSGDVLANLAGPSLPGRVFQFATFGFGLLALTGVLAALSARDVRLFARIQAGATSALLALAWGWVAAYGWVGLTLWSYTPRIYGV
ncbi:MAG: beta-lactamase family protein [Maricaulaceae bacterium]|nr:beta-lactamase family protein [Maricaulaceae bacterium]